MTFYTTLQHHLEPLVTQICKMVDGHLRTITNLIWIAKLHLVQLVHFLGFGANHSWILRTIALEKILEI